MAHGDESFAHSQYTVYFEDGSLGLAMCPDVWDALQLAQMRSPGVRVIAIHDHSILYLIDDDE